MTDGEEYARLRMIVSGRVQGVFFRRATTDEARSLAIKGWVRNRIDGTVEIVAEGRRRNLEILAAWAHLGPPGARVDDLTEEWSEFRNEFKGFAVR